MDFDFDPLFLTVSSVVLIVPSMSIIQNGLENDNKGMVFVGMFMFLCGWALFLSTEYSPARQVGIFIPFISIAIYIYLIWLLDQEQGRRSRLKLWTTAFFLLYISAWFVFGYLQLPVQTETEKMLTWTGIAFVMFGVIGMYMQNRRYNMGILLGYKPRSNTISHVDVIYIAVGWTFFIATQLLYNVRKGHIKL